MRPWPQDEDMCLFWSLETFTFLKYSIIKCIIHGPVARQPALPWQPVCAPLVSGWSLCQPLSMKLIGPPSKQLWCILSVYIVTLTYNLLTLESCLVVPLGWSIPIPSLNWIWLTVQELRRLKFSINRQLSPHFHVFGGGHKGSNFKFHLSTPKRHFLGGNDV